MEWGESERVAIIPYGGGTSVVGGVEADIGSGYTGAVSVDMSGFSGVREIDEMSLSARIGAGTTGPDLEDGLPAVLRVINPRWLAGHPGRGSLRDPVYPH
jgi:alkyldihydroxyacetonephosphate synthase